MRHFLFFVLVQLSASSVAQHLTYAEWQQKSFIDMRLMPNYGNRDKSPEMLASDSAFVAQTLAVIPDRATASDHLVDLGFELLRSGDMTAAMFRFNQAFLLEPRNPSIYRGYGAFFMALDRTAEAGRQYADGLALDTTDTLLMTDLAAVFIAEEYTLRATEPAKADQLLDGAIRLLDRVLVRDPKSTEACFKLSVVYLRKGQCKEARRFRDQCKELGGTQLTAEFEALLAAKCPQ